MFHNRRAHPDIKKTTHRFIDPKKESHSRLRALRTLLGRCNLAHCKTEQTELCDLHAARCSTDLPFLLQITLIRPTPGYFSTAIIRKYSTYFTMYSRWLKQISRRKVSIFEMNFTKQWPLHVYWTQ